MTTGSATQSEPVQLGRPCRTPPASPAPSERPGLLPDLLHPGAAQVKLQLQQQLLAQMRAGRLPGQPWAAEESGRNQ